MKAFLKARRSKSQKNHESDGDSKVDWTMPDDGEDIATMIQKSRPDNKRKADEEGSKSEVDSADIQVVENFENAEDLLWQSGRRKDIGDLAELDNIGNNEDGIASSGNRKNGVLAVPFSRYDSARSDQKNLPEKPINYDNATPKTPSAINACFSLLNINADNIENAIDREQVKIRYSKATISRHHIEESAVSEAKVERPKLESRRSSFK